MTQILPSLLNAYSLRLVVRQQKTLPQTGQRSEDSGGQRVKAKKSLAQVLALSEVEESCGDLVIDN